MTEVQTPQEVIREGLVRLVQAKGFPIECPDSDMVHQPDKSWLVTLRTSRILSEAELVNLEIDLRVFKQLDVTFVYDRSTGCRNFWLVAASSSG